MKKIISLLLLSAMLFVAVSCNIAPDETTDTADTSSSQSAGTAAEGDRIPEAGFTEIR